MIDPYIEHPDGCLCVLCLPTAQGPDYDEYEGENVEEGEIDHLQPEPDLQVS